MLTQAILMKQESEGPRDPEQRPIRQLAAHEPVAQRIEYIALAHRIYVGHRRQQEEEQLGKFEYEFLHRLLGLVHHPALRIPVADHCPDDAGRENHRF
jgi:hypothetical protein